MTAIRSARCLFITAPVLRRAEQVIPRVKSTLTTGNVVENSGSVASNDRINSAGLLDARSLCVPVWGRGRAGKRKKRRRDDARERTAWCGGAERVFEKLKKNCGGVYRSCGWKNFSDGGFWMVVDRSPNTPPRRAALPGFTTRGFTERIFSHEREIEREREVGKERERELAHLSFLFALYFYR